MTPCAAAPKLDGSECNYLVESLFLTLADSVGCCTRVLDAASPDVARRAASGSRPLNYKHWDETRMQKAIDACNGGMTVRQASLQFGIPKSTLGDRMSGGVVPGATSGPKAYLAVDEEEELVEFLLR